MACRGTDGVDGIASAEVAGPGTSTCGAETAAQAKSLPSVIGAGHGSLAPARPGAKISLEFVSANPTGSIHISGIGHGR